jgi:hypothetical protein
MYQTNRINLRGALMIVCVWVQQAQAITIAAGPAEVPLNEWAQASGSALSWNYEGARGLRTRAIDDEPDPRAGLIQMLTGTGLRVQFLPGPRVRLAARVWNADEPPPTPLRVTMLECSDAARSFPVSIRGHVFDFHIAAGPANETLQEFQIQSGGPPAFNISWPAELMLQLRTSAVHGTLHPEHALEQMLTGLGYSFHAVSETTLVVKRRCHWPQLSPTISEVAFLPRKRLALGHFCTDEPVRFALDAKKMHEAIADWMQAVPFWARLDTTHLDFAGLDSRAVHGRYRPIAALNRLLAPAGMHARALGPCAFELAPDPASWHAITIQAGVAQETLPLLLEHMGPDVDLFYDPTLLGDLRTHAVRNAPDWRTALRRMLAGTPFSVSESRLHVTSIERHPRSARMGRAAAEPRSRPKPPAPRTGPSESRDAPCMCGSPVLDTCMLDVGTPQARWAPGCDARWFLTARRP